MCIETAVTWQFGPLARDHERFRRRTAIRGAWGLWLQRSERPPAPGLSVSEPCGEKRNRSSHVRASKRRAILWPPETMQTSGYMRLRGRGLRVKART